MAASTFAWLALFVASYVLSFLCANADLDAAFLGCAAVATASGLVLAVRFARWAIPFVSLLLCAAWGFFLARVRELFAAVRGDG